MANERERAEFEEWELSEGRSVVRALLGEPCDYLDGRIESRRNCETVETAFAGRRSSCLFHVAFGICNFEWDNMEGPMTSPDKREPYHASYLARPILTIIYVPNNWLGRQIIRIFAKCFRQYEITTTRGLYD